MIVFFADGENSRVEDYTSVGFRPPQKDEETSTIFIDNGSSEGRVSMQGLRRQNMGIGEGNFEIPIDQEFTLGFAFNPETSELGYSSKHDVASSVNVTVPRRGWVWTSYTEAEIVDNVSYADVAVS